MWSIFDSIAGHANFNSVQAFLSFVFLLKEQYVFEEDIVIRRETDLFLFYA